MTELKPCPFCGGKAKFFTKAHTERGITRGWIFGIYCSQCDVTTPKTNYALEIQWARSKRLLMKGFWQSKHGTGGHMKTKIKKIAGFTAWSLVAVFQMLMYPRFPQMSEVLDITAAILVAIPMVQAIILFFKWEGSKK